MGITRKFKLRRFFNIPFGGIWKSLSTNKINEEKLNQIKDQHLQLLFFGPKNGSKGL